jgi:hypothetical protein
MMLQNEDKYFQIDFLCFDKNITKSENVKQDIRLLCRIRLLKSTNVGKDRRRLLPKEKQFHFSP